ncbi:hypothetical protein QYF36_020615 [Acer negundo]|nr:hypothetical protein QYF36_020615 [Acer negundo]
MLEEMQQILDKIKHDNRVTPKEIIFCNVISFYGRARLIDHALQVFEEMPEFRVERTVKSFNTLLNVLLNCGKFDKMKETFENMEKHTGPDACSYNILINGCVMSGRFELEEALKLKEDMTKVYNVSPNGHIYASLIKRLCEVSELNSAIGLKQEIVRDKVELESGIYSTLISVMLKVGRKEEVSGIFEEMREKGCNPNTVTYNVMINGLCNKKDFEGAFGMFDVMRIIFNGLCDGMQFEDAALILDEMIFKGFVPRCEHIYKFVDGLCQLGNAKLLWTVLNMLVKANVFDVDIWRMVISKVCKEEELSNAFELVENLTVPLL